MQKIIILVLVVGFLGGAYMYATRNAVPSDQAATSVTADSERDTDKYAVDSQEVLYFGDTNGYLASPIGDGPFPAVVLIHEWWGLNTNIQNLADDFAAEGYVALAVDLYSGEVANTPDRAGELAGGVREDTEAAFSNLAAATDYLAGLPQVDPERLASVGWCFGGQWSYNMAVNDMGIDASVMYYGRFSLEDDLSMMRAHILGHFGEEDITIAIDDVEQFEAKLNTLEGDHSVFIYPNAGHAFANEDNEDAYNEDAAQLAWQRTLDFLDRELALSE